MVATRGTPSKAVTKASSSSKRAIDLEEFCFGGSSDLSEEEDLPTVLEVVANAKKQRARKAPVTYTYVSDSGSDFEEEEERPKKKARPTAGAGAKKPKGQRTIVRELMKTFFETLPLDVVYEIFGYLHPRDLLMLSRTSKMLRSVLTKRSANSVWKAAHSTVGTIPECPPDQSPMQWAQLLFLTDCMICWENNKIRKIDWNLRLRGCEWCLKNNFIYGRRAAIHFERAEPEEVEAALELLPYSNTGGWAHGHASGSHFYYRASVDAMLETLDEYNLRVDAGVEGAREELEAFKAQKRKEADEIVKSGPKLRAWMEMHQTQASGTKDQLIEGRKAAIKAKLIELGHDVGDINSMLWNINTASELTDRAWKTCRARCEALVEESKTRRLALELQRRVEGRLNIVGKLYSEYREELSPPARQVAPSSFIVISNFGPFKEVLESDGAALVTEESFNVAMAQLPDLLEHWRNERSMILLGRVAKVLGWAPLPALETMTKAEMDGEMLKLTKLTSAFVCNDARSPQVLYAEDVYQHVCDTRWHQNQTLQCFKVDADVITAIRELAMMVGLNPETAKPEEMDAVNARFYCKNCLLSGNDTRYARPWRLAAAHHASHLTHQPQSWIRLGDADTQAVIVKENTNWSDGIERMICHRCDEGKPRIALNQMKNHMRFKHHITPVDSADYHPDPRIAALLIGLPTGLSVGIPTGRNQGPGPGLSVAAGLDAAKAYRCKRCTKSQRGFILQGVKSHIKAVHKVSNPIQDTDYHIVRSSGFSS